jgi:hypothetical protein
MNKYPSTDDTLRELWAIKDETAARYKTVAEYFAHLGLTQAPKRPSRVASRRVPVKPKAIAGARRTLPA